MDITTIEIQEIENKANLLKVNKHDLAATVNDKTQIIRELNDDLRKSWKNGKITLSPAIKDLSEKKFNELKRMVQCDNYSGYDDEGDAQQHEFGTVPFGDANHILWSIDYHDNPLNNNSPDASNPALTNRELKIIFSYEI